MNVKELISKLQEYPADTEVVSCFDAGGNFYYPEPTLVEGYETLCKKKTKVLVLSHKVVDDYSKIKDTVNYAK